MTGEWLTTLKNFLKPLIVHFRDFNII